MNTTQAKKYLYDASSILLDWLIENTDEDFEEEEEIQQAQQLIEDALNELNK